MPSGLVLCCQLVLVAIDFERAFNVHVHIVCLLASQTRYYTATAFNHIAGDLFIEISKALNDGVVLRRAKAL